MMLFLKSQVRGYTKQDGTYVKPHSNKVTAKPQAAPIQPKYGYGSGKQASLPGFGAHKPNPPKLVAPQFGIGKPPRRADQETDKPQVFHPRPDDAGAPVEIKRPHAPRPPAHWSDPSQVARCLPGEAMPLKTLNGVPFAPWTDAPKTHYDWDRVEGQKPDLDEPYLDLQGKEPAAGVVIEEPDGRVWVVCPTNQHAGYHATYPKGHADDGLSLQASAIKEAFEESGLKVEITGFLGDFAGGLTMTRYYRARRVGGTPSDMGWETQAVQLVPRDKLDQVVNAKRDQDIAAVLRD